MSELQDWLEEGPARIPGSAFTWVPELTWTDQPRVPEFRWHVKCVNLYPGPHDYREVHSGWCATPEEALQQLRDMVNFSLGEVGPR